MVTVQRSAGQYSYILSITTANAEGKVMSRGQEGVKALKARVINSPLVISLLVTKVSSSYQVAGQGWHVSSPSLLQLLRGSRSNP